MTEFGEAGGKAQSSEPVYYEADAVVAPEDRAFTGTFINPTFLKPGTIGEPAAGAVDPSTVLQEAQRTSPSTQDELPQLEAGPPAWQPARGGRRDRTGTLEGRGTQGARGARTAGPHKPWKRDWSSR